MNSLELSVSKSGPVVCSLAGVGIGGRALGAGARNSVGNDNLPASLMAARLWLMLGQKTTCVPVRLRLRSGGGRQLIPSDRFGPRQSRSDYSWLTAVRLIYVRRGAACLQ